MEFGRRVKQRRIQNEIAYEDMAPILYIRYTLRGTLGMSSIKHVVIDEAQDYSPIQYKLFAKRFENSKFTVLGDINQIVHPFMNIGQYTECFKIFEEKKSIFMELTNSYRCTKQIGAFSHQILMEDKPIKYFNRNGEKVKVIQVKEKEKHFEEVFQSVQSFMEKQYTHIGIIGKNIEECQEIYDYLKNKMTVNFSTQGEEDFKKGVSILPIYLAKGLEFEGVILHNVNCNNYKDVSDRKLFYTAVTRALHEVHIFCREEISPFIKNIDPGLYEYRRI
jgi:DNA helicase-2/ATP-dependent DNA helicase PcrA